MRRIGPWSAAGALAALVCVTPPPSLAAMQPAEFSNLAFDQHPGRTLPADAELVDETSQGVRLAELLDGRPGILVLEYLRCPNLCGLVLGGLAEGLSATGLASGRDYRVLAVSIDPKEGPADSGAARRAYTDRFGAGAIEGWRFLTGGHEASAQRLAAAVGFPYRWDPTAEQWAHPAGAVVVTPSGVISRYLLGVDFDPLGLRLALLEASGGMVAGPTASLLLLCYGYDPKTGRYTLAVMTILRAAGLLTCLVGAGLLVRALRREKRPAGA